MCIRDSYVSPNQTCPVLGGCSHMKLWKGHKTSWKWDILVWFGMTIHVSLVDSGWFLINFYVYVFKIILSDKLSIFCVVSQMAKLTAHKSSSSDKSTRNLCMVIPNHTKPKYPIFSLFYDHLRYKSKAFSTLGWSLRFLSGGQCCHELFKLFDYSNSWDRIVVFSIHIR